jgi:hypothetical protein
MLKILFTGIWILATTLASSYVAASWKTGKPPAAEAQPLIGLNYTKTPVINVPMIAEGAIAGYVIAQFVYTADSPQLNGLSVPPDPFIVDEAFRTIYEDVHLDFENLERYDIAALTTRIRTNVNGRFGRELVEDVLVEQFNYISSDEVRAQGGKTGKTPVLGGDLAEKEAH